MNIRVRAGMTVSSILACAGLAQAQSFSEGFESGAIPPTWATQNLSSPPGNGTGGWVASATGQLPGAAAIIPPFAGTFSAYANFNSCAGTGTISNWLFSPQATSINNGDTLSFWTRTRNPSTYPDRMQVRMSNAGPSVNAGVLATDVGDFTNLLLDINPTYQAANGYPTAWTQQSITVSGLPATANGRFAFRYFVENGGPTGINSEIVGLDDVLYAPGSATGACCRTDGTCAANQTAAQCSAAGGSWAQNTPCAQANCPAAVACCSFEGACSNLTAAACAAQGGTAGAAGSSCATTNCPAACAAVTGSFTGLGTGTSSDPGAVFGTQTTRLFRDGVPDTCALAAPGGSPIAGTFTYVRHNLQNNSPNPVCVDFRATINCPTNQLYGAAYYGIGGYDPSNPSANNVASTGSSAAAGTIAMSFTVPGNTAFSIVLAEVTSGGGCTSYSWRVNGGGNLSCNTPAGCYANCDNSTQAPVLNVQDFSCFLTRYAAGESYANCDSSTQQPVLNVQDFSCFLTKYAAGCP